MNKNHKNIETIDQSRRAFFTAGSLTATKASSKEGAAVQGAALIAKISHKCLAIDQVACQICGDICEPRAIKFFWTSKKVPMPQINEGACTGCGDCLSICPPTAIFLEPSSEPIEVKTNAN